MGQFITPDNLPTDTFCRRLLIPNDPKWIGTISGALMVLMYPSEWSEIDGITAEEAAERSKVMLNDFWNSDCCGDDCMNCCEDRVILHRFDPATGRPQVSDDGGLTWTSDPADLEHTIPLLQPLVFSGGGKTKCDAATNASEHVNELIDACLTNLETAGTVFELAVAIAGAALALFLIFVSAGVLTAPVTAFVTAIWAAGTAAFELGAEAFDLYWTVDKKDAILCAIFCNIGEDGQFTEAQYQAFKAKCYAVIPASPALDLVMTSINAGGARGLSQMASYGNAALADCSSCSCSDSCAAAWIVLPLNGTIVSRSGASVFVEAEYYAPEGVWLASIGYDTNNMDCCKLASMVWTNPETVAISQMLWLECGETRGVTAYHTSSAAPINHCVNTIAAKMNGACTVEYILTACD